jgi:hypothetical protein
VVAPQPFPPANFGAPQRENDNPVNSFASPLFEILPIYEGILTRILLLSHDTSPKNPKSRARVDHSNFHRHGIGVSCHRYCYDAVREIARQMAGGGFSDAGFASLCSGAPEGPVSRGLVSVLREQRFSRRVEG